LSFYQNIFIWDLVLKDLLEGIQYCNQNLIWLFDFWVITFLASLNNGSTTGCHGLSGAVEVAYLHVERTT
jgi:hypothetical protein